ncbi:hypothetical protein WJX72_005928 [[Myrmecia] bisecta]|uniref:Uncharacterized protein n=1 Tax=[Myrmecia] bisecta TaxID=41462 RepID=A0AAW1QRH8_9CHLO
MYLSNAVRRQGVVKLVAHHAPGALLIGSLHLSDAHIHVRSIITSIATATRAIGERPWVVTADPSPHGEFVLAVNSLAGAAASPGELEAALEMTLKKCNLRLSSIEPEDLRRLQDDMQTDAAGTDRTVTEQSEDNVHSAHVRVCSPSTSKRGKISPQVLPSGHVPILAAGPTAQPSMSAMDALLALAGEDYTYGKV